MLRTHPDQFDAFTDREAQCAAFRRLLTAGATTRILVFTGISGNGKSFLVDYFIACELPPDTSHALLDFEGNPDLLGDPAALLDATLGALEPLPERARRDYRDAARAIQDRRDDALVGLRIHQEARGEGGALVQVTQEVNLGPQLDSIHRRARRDLAQALADLARQARHPDGVRVILLDGYEFLRRGDERYEAWTWTVLNGLLETLPGLRFVVAGREAPRPRLPAERPDELRLFTPDESDTYLRARDVPAALRARLHELTGGHPLLLSMAAGLARGPEPLTLHDLETAPAAGPGQRPVAAWLYGRILDRMPPDARRLAETAALLRRFDTDVLAALLPDEVPGGGGLSPAPTPHWCAPTPRGAGPCTTWWAAPAPPRCAMKGRNTPASSTTAPPKPGIPAGRAAGPPQI